MSMDQALYEKAIANGESPRLAEMLACRQAPGARTNDTFLRGQRNGQQFSKCPEMAHYLSKELRARGGSPEGKVYKSGLARYPGDPEAWVGDDGDVARVCRERGWGCKSATVNVEAHVPDSVAPGVELDMDIVKAEVAETLRENPGIAPTPKERERLVAETYDKRKPNRKKLKGSKLGV